MVILLDGFEDDRRDFEPCARADQYTGLEQVLVIQQELLGDSPSHAKAAGDRIRGIDFFDKDNHSLRIVFDCILTLAAASSMAGQINRNRIRTRGKTFNLGLPEKAGTPGTVNKNDG